MAKDLEVTMAGGPGTLAKVAEALGAAGVNLDGFAGMEAGGRGIGHFLVEDAAAARRAIEQAGGTVGAERDAVVVEAEDRPGELGKVARKVATAGVNIMAAYVATNSRIVVVADDASQVRSALGR
jgi:hypothetical protein